MKPSGLYEYYDFSTVKSSGKRYQTDNGRARPLSLRERRAVGHGFVVNRWRCRANISGSRPRWATRAVVAMNNGPLEHSERAAAVCLTRFYGVQPVDPSDRVPSFRNNHRFAAENYWATRPPTIIYTKRGVHSIDSGVERLLERQSARAHNLTGIPFSEWDLVRRGPFWVKSGVGGSVVRQRIRRSMRRHPIGSQVGNSVGSSYSVSRVHPWRVGSATEQTPQCPRTAVPEWKPLTLAGWSNLGRTHIRWQTICCPCHNIINPYNASTENIIKQHIKVYVKHIKWRTITVYILGNGKIFNMILGSPVIIVFVYYQNFYYFILH